MRITLLQEKLKSGINVVERITGKSLSLPILNNTLIKVEKNFLNLATTDLEIGINWWTLVKTEKEGKITVPTKLLSSFVNFLPNKPITLEAKDLILKIECQNYQTSLKGTNPEDFPIIPTITNGKSILVNSQFFCQNLSQVVDIASYSTTRPEISGVYFLFQKNLISMAATDSFRLGEKKLFLEPPLINLSQEYSLILPQRAAKEIVNIFGEKEGNLKISFSPNQILFEIPLAETPHPQIQLVSRLIEGEFPNYQEIIPKKYDTQVVLPRNEFINQIKLASLFSGKISEIKVKIDPKQNRVVFLSQNSDLGDYQSFLTGKVEGKPCEISFNHRFLLDGLLNIKNSEIVLQLTGGEGPGVLKPKGDPSYLYLVMPIKAS
jgi:DNA polymerase-3 subunit beta